MTSQKLKCDKTQNGTKLEILNWDKIKKISVQKKLNFWKEVFWLGQLDTLTTDEMYSGQHLVISQCFMLP